ncbi:MAG: HupE/UreJ family protein [Pseudomonadota bacterium]
MRARWDGPGRVRGARFLCFVLLLLSAVPAHAHFTAGAKAQTIIVTSDGEALIRMPLPLLFADRIPEAIAARSPIDSPFLRVESTGVGSRYRLDLAAIANAPERWAARLTGTIRFDSEGVQLAPALVRYRIHGRSPGDRFRSVAEAQTALDGEGTSLDPIFGEAVVDMHLALSPELGAGALTVGAAHPPLALPPTVTIDTHVIDARFDPPVLVSLPAQLAEPVVLEGPQPVFLEFFERGVAHILGGLDHIFLVLCLALGLGWSRHLFWLVTTFTLGHSVTLALGSLGLVVPLASVIGWIEAGIALTVVAAAYAAWRRTRMTLAVGFAVGLLHGFGFASFLSESLVPGDPQFALALLGFNIGIELGQIAVVLAALAGLELVRRVHVRAGDGVRHAALLGIGAVSLLWVVERVGALA